MRTADTKMKIEKTQLLPNLGLEAEFFSKFCLNADASDLCGEGALFTEFNLRLTA